MAKREKVTMTDKQTDTDTQARRLKDEGKQKAYEYAIWKINIAIRYYESNKCFISAANLGNGLNNIEALHAYALTLESRVEELNSEVEHLKPKSGGYVIDRYYPKY